MSIFVRQLAILAFITLASTARTPIASETIPAEGLRNSFLSFKAKPNWILNREATFATDADRQTTVDFLLGFFTEIYLTGELVDHDEFNRCVQPDKVVHNYTQRFIGSALSLNYDNLSFEEYHNNFYLKVWGFRQAFLSIIQINCPGNGFDNYIMTRCVDRIKFVYADYLSETWEANQIKMQTYFKTFAAAIKTGDYKHAHAQGILASM